MSTKNFIAQLAERLYRIANFDAMDREQPLTKIDEPGLLETHKALEEAFNLWQIVIVDDMTGDHSDLDDSEIVALKGSRNTIFSGTREMAAVHAHAELVKLAEEHHKEFFDEEAPIEYKTEINEGGFMVLSALIDGELFAEATLYPVEIVHA